MSQPVFNALIRTHHITSRKKVGKLRDAASNCNIYALLRSSGCPGIMYCQGSESGVRDWVSNVQRLRYKDFQLVKKPAQKVGESKGHVSGGKVEVENLKEGKVPGGTLEEVENVKEFGARMDALGVWTWWRKGMGYVGEDSARGATAR